LLGELKVARLAAPSAGATLNEEALVAMVTTVPARLLGWDAHLGSITPGRRADLLVVDGTSGDPIGCLIDATETDITLVLINGVPRSGTPDLMTACGITTGEDVTIDGHARNVNLTEASADPAVASLTVAEAQAALGAALTGLPDHDRQVTARLPEHQIRLAVEGLVDNKMSPRHHLALAGVPTGPNLPGARAAVGAAAPINLPALTLQPLTAAGNPGYGQTLGSEMNLPAAVRDGLTALYGT
jgi:hypothetical protein